MSEKMNEKRREPIHGLFLIALGGVLLLNQLFDGNLFGLMVVAGLGLFFMTWGVLTRTGGLMIPGGILSGIGLGIIVTEGPLANMALRQSYGESWFLASCALGWFAIVVMTGLFSEKMMVWPLIPGGIMATIAASIALGGIFESGLSLAGRGWPIILIALGVWTLINQRRRHEQEKEAIFK